MIRLLCSLVAILGMLRLPATAGEIPYLTNLEAACKLAAEQNKIVLLYTGRVQFCEKKDPKTYFFQTVLKEHPKLATRGERYVVCEQFHFADQRGPDGRLSKQFLEESKALEGLYDRYDLRLYYPTVTFLSPNQELLNGPFRSLKPMCDTPFSSLDRDCYETLTDYANADRPRTLREAQADLAAAVMRPPSEPLQFEILRYRHHPAGGQKVLLLDTGLPSDQYELLEAVPFTVRDAAAEIAPATRAVPNCGIHAVGSLGTSLPADGAVLIRLNGAYFRATIKPVGEFTGSGPVKFRPNEHHIWVHARQRQIAEEMVRGFRQLPNSAVTGTAEGNALSKRIASEEFARYFSAKIGPSLEFPADRLIVEESTGEWKTPHAKSRVRTARIFSTDAALVPFGFTFGKKGTFWTGVQDQAYYNATLRPELDRRTTIRVVTLPNGNELYVKHYASSSNSSTYQLIARHPLKEVEVQMRLDLHKHMLTKSPKPPETRAYFEMLAGPPENLSKHLENCIELALEAAQSDSFKASEP